MFPKSVSDCVIHARLDCHTTRASQRHKLKGLSKNATCRKRQKNRNFMEKKWQTVDIIMNQTEIACSQMS